MTVGLPDPVPEIADADLLPAGRPTAAFIDLGALQENFRALRSFAGSGRDVLAVVKAEAYGHGGREAASAFVEAGAGWLGVATAEEGEALRSGAGVPAGAGLSGGTRILVMSGAYPDLAPRLIAADLDAVVWDAAQAEALAAAGAAAGRPARIHLKVDSGMRRLGIAPGEAADFLRKVRAMPGLEVAGLMSHLARADEEDGEEPTRAQLEIVRSLIETLGDLLPPAVHCANSAGGLMYPDAPGGLVRAGIALYGAPPAHAKGIGLRPAMTLKSAIVSLKEVSAGEAVGYGGTYRRSSAGRIAVVPIGYADGYPRLLSNRADALVRGSRVPVAGRVSMDMLTLDVSGLAGAAVGDEVVLIGAQGDEAVSCGELAGRAHTISYEILSRIGLRVPRVFFRGGRITGSRMLGGRAAWSGKYKIEIRGLEKSFGANRVLRGVDLKIGEGEITVIIGRSGEGKSVLLKHIIGLLRPDGGEILIDGENIAALRGAELNRMRVKFGMLFQGGALFDSMTVGDNISFPLREHTRFSGEEISKRVRESLHLVGLDGIEERMPDQLSGGMRKRVALARAIIREPEILLYDEPTTGLDPLLSDSIDRLISRMRDSLGITSVVISHDIKHAMGFAHTIAMLHEGRIIASGSPAEIEADENPVVRQFLSGSSEGPIQVL